MTDRATELNVITIGQAGPKGDPGDPGEQGPPGEPGADGASADLSSPPPIGTATPNVVFATELYADYMTINPSSPSSGFTFGRTDEPEVEGGKMLILENGYGDSQVLFQNAGGTGDGLMCIFIQDTYGSVLVLQASNAPGASLQTGLGFTAQGVIQTASDIQALGGISVGGPMRPADPASGQQNATGFYGYSGAPDNAYGFDGHYYFRSDGAPGSYIYHKSAGVWTAIL